MPRVRVAVRAVELRLGAAARANATVTATANGRALGSPFTSSRPSTIINLPPSFRTDVEVADGARIQISVVIRDGAGIDRTVAFGVRVPTGVGVERHETESVTVTATLLPLGSTVGTRGVGTRGDAGGGRSTILVGRRLPRIRVEVVHPVSGVFACPAEGHTAEVVRMGLWDEAWDASGATFRNGGTDDAHFIGRDPRRFYVRVIDPSAAGRRSVTVNVRTRYPSGAGSVHDDGAGSPAITCTPVAGHPGVFASRALMLVSSAVDLQVPNVHSGDIPGGGGRARGQPDFRLRLASMFGFVEAEYANAAAPARAELFRGERRILHLRLYEVGGALRAGGRSVSDLWDTDLRVAREIYGRIGIWLWTSPAPEVATADRETYRYPGATSDEHLARVTQPRPAGVTGVPTRTDNELALAQAHPGPAIRCFFRGAMDGVAGEAWPLRAAADDMGRRLDLLNSLFIDCTDRGPYTLAHEILHILLDIPGRNAAEMHYRGDDTEHNVLRHRATIMGPLAVLAGGLTRHEAWDASSRIRLNQAETARSRIDSL
ncbi:hypothetical protein BE21_21165 [Sorangium cellulosum]|uniref:Uncharacterized protein n=1 Tax=Sorangium cellulosum TaxID=56 RepID=A0A150TVY6_SORCE|nr:hypothetical protein BE21_21165 [Sorangium cellulosum]